MSDASIVSVGFASAAAKPAAVHYHPVVDQIIRANPLDPLGAIAFAATFVIVAVLTSRRPVYGLCAMIAMVPFAFYHDILGTTVTMSKVALLGTLLGLTTYGGAFRALGERPARRLLLAALLVLLATALSIAQATAISPAIRETLKIAEYVLVFATAYVCYRLDPDVTLVTWVIAATAVAVALLALAQEVLGAPSGLYFNNIVIPRIAGPLEGPNQLAGYLEVAIAVLSALMCARPRREVAAALAILAFSDVLTFSRAGLLGALVAVIVVCTVYRRAAVALIAPLAAGVVCGVAATGFWAEAAHTLRVFRFSTSSGTNYAGGVGTRAELWRAAIALWRRHPLLGVGAGNYELDLPLVGLYGVRTHANSLYLQSLVEGGVPLVLATLFLLWTSIVGFVRDAGRSPFIAGALAASVALAVHQIFDYLVFYPKVGEWWWIVLALGAASLQAAREPARVSTAEPVAKEVCA